MFSHFLRSHLFNIILSFQIVNMHLFTTKKNVEHTHTHTLNEYKPEEYECKLLTIQ